MLKCWGQSAQRYGNTTWQVVDTTALFSLHPMFIYENLMQSTVQQTIPFPKLFWRFNQWSCSS